MAEANPEEVIGRVTFERFGGSWAFWAEPRGWDGERPITFCLGCHGSGGWVTAGEADWLRTKGAGRATVARLVERGFLVGMSHAAGDAWGNAAGQGDSVALVEAMRRRYPLAPRIVMFGRSMGGPLAVNLALGRLAGQVSRIALLQPVVNLADRLPTGPEDTLGPAYEDKWVGSPSSSGGVQGSISLAGKELREQKGLPTHLSEWAERVAAFCPLTQMRSRAALGPAAPPLPPLKAWQNRSDRTCRIELTEALLALWRQAGGQADLVTLDGEGHTVYGAEPVASEVAEFLSVE